MRRHAILVLGCPRSGATALAAALAHAGAYAGRTFVPAPPGEPAGTWQPASIAAFNERLLGTLGMRWDSLLPMPDRWRERASVRAFDAEADALIADEFGKAEHVVLHEPRLALTAPFWRERLEQAGFEVACVLVVRRPAEVAASMSRREPVAPEKALALWLSYLAESERGSRGGARTLITFDRLLDAPAGVLSHVVADTRFGLRIERSGREAALAAIRPELRRFDDANATPLARLSSGIDVVLEEGYQQLARLAPGADPRRAVDAILQAAHAPLLQAIPPWLALELAKARGQAERHADALREAGRQVDELRAALAVAEQASASRDDRESELNRRIHDLTKPRPDDGRELRVDEALAQLRSDMARVAGTLADLPERERRLLIENAQLQRDLADERTTIAKLSDAFERERNAAERLGAELATTQANLQAFAEEVEQARAAERAWNEHGEALAHDLDEAQAAMNVLQTERDALRRERDDATRQLAKLREELDGARADLRIVDNDRNALAARAQAVTDAAGALREELGRRATAEQALCAERDRLSAALRQQAERVTSLERELERRIADLTNLSGRHESLGKTLSAVEKTWMGRRALSGLRRNGSS